MTSALSSARHAESWPFSPDRRRFTAPPTPPALSSASGTPVQWAPSPIGSRLRRSPNTHCHTSHGQHLTTSGSDVFAQGGGRRTISFSSSSSKAPDTINLRHLPSTITARDHRDTIPFYSAPEQGTPPPVPASPPQALSPPPPPVHHRQRHSPCRKTSRQHV